MVAGALTGVFGFQPELAAQDHGHGGGGMAPTGNQPVTVRTEQAQSQSLGREIELTGSVEATRIARLASPGEGPVKSSRWREGDRVTTGEPLVEIGRAGAATAELALARQLLREQEQEFERMETLVAAGAIPGAGLDAARSKYENARAQVARAEQNSADYLVKAPWNGVISKVLIQDGDYVAPRLPLVEMFDPASLVIRFAVPEAQAMEVQEGMEVAARLDAYPGRSWPGRISRVYPELEARSRTRTAEATLSGEVALIPGMFTRLTVEQERVHDAITVPAAAVIATPHGQSVFVVEAGKAVRRKVTTGIEAGGAVQILSGIQAGEEIVTAGHERLKDGSPVRVAGGDPAAENRHQAEGSGHSAGQPENRGEHQPSQPGHQPDGQPAYQPNHLPAQQPGHQTGGHGQ
jgi:membrane fusion protein (multidrug efflux system)